MEGEEEEVELAGDVLFSPAVSVVGPSTPSSLLAVSACSRCSGWSITSCPGGCSTMMLVSEMSENQHHTRNRMPEEVR